MTQAIQVLTIDIGASGGKVQLGSFDGKKISQHDAYRFTNSPVKMQNHVYWDFLRLFGEVKAGIKAAHKQADGNISCLGLDTWGVDYALLDRNGQLIENPHSYRDPRTNGMMEEVFRIIPKRELYFETGVQFMQFNTIFQLYSMLHCDKRALDHVSTFFMIPDLFNYFLSGRKGCEYTNATTTQFYDPIGRDWHQEILKKINIDPGIMADITMPGTILGELSKWICDDLEIEPLPVATVATHDTASAASVVPDDEVPHAFLSSGTWSLIGFESNGPVINEAGFENNFSSYGGASGEFLVWKNIQALWLLQECMRKWKEEGHDYSHEDIIRIARQAAPLRSIIDTDGSDFLTPGNFPKKIFEFCKETGQYAPTEHGEISRCVLDSLALKYRYTFERLQEVIGKRMQKINVIGGGARNTLLNQFTADATGVMVESGPYEATSIGNLLLQLIALGEVRNLDEGREIIRASFKTEIFEPGNQQAWDLAYERYLEICKQSRAFNKT